MKRVLFLSLAAAIVYTMAGAGIQAHDGLGQSAAASPQRTWYSVTITTVKPDRVAQWLEIQKSETIPMQQKGGIKNRETWQSGAPFGDGNTFGIVTPIDKFATYDMPNLASRVLGEAPARVYQDKLAAVTVSRRTFAVQDRAELSLPPTAGAKIVAAILQDVTVISGHTEQYESYLRDDVLPVLKKGNVLGMTVSRTVFGGNGNEYHLVTYLDSFAQLDKGPAQVQVLGQQAAAALTAKGAQHIANIERAILRYVPELSFRPKSLS